MISEMERTAQPLPDGVIRLSSAPVDSPDYLTETFLSALYGEAARGLLGEDSTHSHPVQDAALYLWVNGAPFRIFRYLHTM